MPADVSEEEKEEYEEGVMEQIYNPYLPLNEYIPDGEPHVFGDRVYIYGSHDRAGGTAYCEQHYQVWSAPVGKLRDWRNEGVSYLRTQDPSNADDSKQLWAPDVAQGPDGRYYLYYCFSFYPEIGVAVSEKPAGPFAFYGHVHYPKHILGGKLLQEGMVFDPAVLVDDDGRIYLYYGFCPAGEKEMCIPQLSEEEIAAFPEDAQAQHRQTAALTFGENSMVVELEQDMVTVKGEPHSLIPGGHHTAGTGFEGHGFFEASSIRKLRGKYYFVYSSHKSHELCYATSDRPDGGFTYGGTIVSNGDIGLDGRETPVYPLGNNHGGLVEIGDEVYIFYHRQTNATEYSRQGCAERVTVEPDGSIRQVAITSCGLNGGALAASGVYPAAIACHLTDPTVLNRIDYADPVLRTQVRITERQNQHFITGIKDQTTVGYKVFQFPGEELLGLELRGNFAGSITVSHDEADTEAIGEYELRLRSEDWGLHLIPITPEKGTHALYLHFAGAGNLELKSLAFADL